MFCSATTHKSNNLLSFASNLHLYKTPRLIPFQPKTFRDSFAYADVKSLKWMHLERKNHLVEFDWFTAFGKGFNEITLKIRHQDCYFLPKTKSVFWRIHFISYEKSNSFVIQVKLPFSWRCLYMSEFWVLIVSKKNSNFISRVKYDPFFSLLWKFISVTVHPPFGIISSGKMEYHRCHLFSIV